MKVRNTLILVVLSMLVAAPGVRAAEPLPAAQRTAPAEASRSDSGLAWRVVEAGKGSVSPGPEDHVLVRFTGWNAEGEVIDSTDRLGKAVPVPFARTLPGWREALATMTAGETRRLWVPESLAYAGQPGKPAGTVIFDLTLEEVLAPPPAPPDVAAPPATAERSRSGLAWIVLEPGTGDRHPKKRDRVTVHYSGWTTDGRLFDSSRLRAEPTSFPLNAVIEGWTEGLQMMVEGERRRFWVPEELAYDGAEGKPAGMLVFDVELIGIE